MNNHQDKIIITNFTDPVCTWCWGTEPVFRKLETHFPGQIEFHYVMGGLVEDVHQMHDPANGIGSPDVRAFNRQVASHWLDAGNRHGMPVDAEHFELFSEEYPSTYPQNIAYKAAQLSDPDKADLFLYNLRAAAAAEARQISHEKVQEEIAAETGMNVTDFLARLNDGSAKKAFYDDLARAEDAGVHVFPTFLIKFDKEQYILRGFNSYEDFAAVIHSAAKGAVKPVSVKAEQESLQIFMQKHPRMAAEEIRQAFELKSIAEVKAFVTPMLECGKAELQEAGNGWFVKLVKEVPPRLPKDIQ